MEWLLIALTGSGAAWLGVRLRHRSAARREDEDELAGVRQLADEDVTMLGEELQRLDADVSGNHLDEAARLDYQRALDAYESAQRAVPRIRHAAEISKITDTLSTGRYALACVQARVAGRPVPELRVPCFFNPQHGPSVTNVRYTAPGRGTRTVPACARDAARIAAHESPEVRKVKIGSRMVPYWEAGAAYLPYGQGYFVTPEVGIFAMGWAFEAQTDFGFSGDHGSSGGGDFGGWGMGDVSGLGDGGDFGGN